MLFAYELLCFPRLYITQLRLYLYIFLIVFLYIRRRNKPIPLLLKKRHLVLNNFPKSFLFSNNLFIPDITMSKTRQQKVGEQSNIDSFMRKDPPSEDPPFTNKEIKQMFANLEKNQSSIKTSIENKNKNEDSRLNKNEKMVESINDNVNRITESIDKIIPRLGAIEARLTSVEERLDATTDLERNLECLEDVEQALPRIGTIEDRLTEIEEQLNDRVKLQKRVVELEEQALWEELERKKQNLVVYGLEGSESPEETLGVTKTFMREKLKLDPKWVEEVQLKAAVRLQGNGKGPLPIRISFMWPKDRDTQRALYVQCTYIVPTVRTMYVHCTYSARWDLLKSRTDPEGYEPIPPN